MNVYAASLAFQRSTGNKTTIHQVVAYLALDEAEAQKIARQELRRAMVEFGELNPVWATANYVALPDEWIAKIVLDDRGDDEGTALTVDKDLLQAMSEAGQGDVNPVADETPQLPELDEDVWGDFLSGLGKL